MSSPEEPEVKPGTQSGDSMDTEHPHQLNNNKPIRRKYEEAFDHGKDAANDDEEEDSLEDHIVPQATPLNFDASVELQDANATDVAGDNETMQTKPTPPLKVFPCQVYSCSQTFTSNHEYQNHYSRRHMHVCATCKKSLPSSHILELHVLELHDTFFALMSQRKPMYDCLLETCREKFQDIQQRKTHCMEVHNFPEKFQYWEFRLPEKKHPGSKSKCNDYSGHKSKSNKQKGKGIEVPKDSSMDTTTNAEMMESSQNILPEDINVVQKRISTTRYKNITFGHASQRTFRKNYSFGLSTDSNNRTDRNKQRQQDGRINSNTKQEEEQMDLTTVQKELLKII